MLPRRGYEPVDDGDEENTNASHAITGSHLNDNTGAEEERSARRLCNSVTENDAIGKEKAQSTTNNDEEGAGALGSGNEGGDNGMAIRVLDVRGVFYPLRGLTPETTVRELKLMLVTETGVEMERQRIIHAGKMLEDTDTFASRKISDGTTIHLFQRPKTAVTNSVINRDGAGSGAILEQQPGGLHEFPPIYLQVNGGGDGAGGAAGSPSHWEVDGARRKLRFLASFLLLISILQLLGCLASISAAASTSTTGDNGDSGEAGEGEAQQLILSDEYWALEQARAVSSAMGIVVGLVGIRSSQSLSIRTIKIYLVGLVMCALVAMAIRIQMFFDIISGKLPFDDGVGSPSSSSDYEPDEGAGGGTGAGSGGEAYDETAGEAGIRMFFTAFSSSISVLVSGIIWVLCIRRVNSVRGFIHQHTGAWERQERGEGPEGGGARHGGGRLMDAASDPELQERHASSVEA